MRKEKEIVTEEAAERFSSICTYVDDFRKVIASNAEGNENSHYAASWNYLKYHADLCILLALASKPEHE